MRTRLAVAGMAIRRRVAHEGGFAFPELSVAMLVTGIVVASGLAFVVVSVHQWGGQEGRVAATDSARNALNAISLELRDAASVTLVNATTVDALLYSSNGSTSNVRFACEIEGETGTCTRTDLSSGETTTVVDGVTNPDNFTRVLGSDVAGTSSENGTLQIKLDVRIEDTTSESDPDDPLSLLATVKPRNCVAAPAAGVLNPPC
jgi:Tfp pilus assembly protein PilW